MKTRCPACGAVNSLDALIAHDDARQALAALVKLGDETTKLTLRYLALFRPTKTELTFRRVAALINELLPDIHAQRIMRNGNVYAAPLVAWHHAMQQALTARENGTLKTPLKSHGWLYEVISNYQPSSNVTVATSATNNASTSAPSKTMASISKLENMKR